jgi:hypothetical protein
MLHIHSLWTSSRTPLLASDCGRGGVPLAYLKISLVTMVPSLGPGIQAKDWGGQRGDGPSGPLAGDRRRH